MRGALSTAAPGRVRAAGFAALALLPFAACTGSTPDALTTDARPRLDFAALTTFEVRDDNVDRFEHCPPAGDVGEAWIPPLADWRPPAAYDQTEASPSADDQDASPSPAAASLRELVDQAARETHMPFRHCYHDGLRFDPTQDGRVALVLRVGATGKVESVETWGACDLAPESIACMRDVAGRLVLRPPAAGFATVLVPGVFTEGLPRRRTASDAYTAAAYVAVEALRPELHRCEEDAKRDRSSLFARATLTVDIDANGRALHVSVDDWKGSQGLLACAAQVLESASFPPPPTGKGRVVAPLVYNPKLEAQVQL